MKKSREGSGSGDGGEPLIFTQGSRVEVSSDDEGFRGAWYIATIIDNVPSSSTPPSKRKRKRESNEFLVEYETLLGEDQKPLREYTRASFVRPLPPSSATVNDAGNPQFELYDVVEAFFRDGWWTGVVTGAEDPKFTVLFQEPAPPHEIEFDRSALRVHLDWIDGKWIRPLKHQAPEEGKDGLQGNKKNIIGEKKKTQPRVKKLLTSAKGKEGNAKGQKNQTTVAEKKRTPKSGVKTPHDSITSKKDDPWGGKKVRGSGTKKPIRPTGESSVKRTSNKGTHLTDSEIHNVKGTIEPKGGVSTQKRKRGRPRMVEGPRGNGAEAAAFYEMVGKDCATNEAVQSTLAGICFQGIMDLTDGFPLQISQGHTNMLSNLVNLPLAVIDNRLSKTIAEQPTKLKKFPSEGNQRSMTENESLTQDSQDACREKTSEVLKDQPLLSGLEAMNSPSTVDDPSNTLGKTVIQGAVASDGQDENATHCPAIASTGNDVSRKIRKGQCAEATGQQEEKAMQSPAIASTGNDMSQKIRNALGAEAIHGPDENGVLSPAVTSTGNDASQKTGNKQCAEASDGLDENTMPCPAITSTGNDVSQKTRNLPFVKRSPIWETLEKLETFKRMPQQPHFCPLDKHKEDVREGLAIGNMVTFSTVVETTSKLQFSDPTSVINSCLETLCGLESHGFEVDPIRGRLKELLTMKEREGRFLEELKEVEMKIGEHSLEKSQIEEEIHEISKKMEELQEKDASAKSMGKIKDYEIATLKSEMDAIDQDIRNSQLDFERLAAAPW